MKANPELLEIQEPEEVMHDARKDLRPKIRMTILAASLGFVLVQLDVSTVNIALAKIGADLGTPVAGLQWVVDAYALAFAALLLSAGALGDQIGARKGFSIGFAAFVVASLGCGLAPGPIALIVARTAQGIGAALLVPCSLALLNQAAAGDARLRATAVSLWTAAGSVAMAVGPVLGGLLVDTLGWRSIFLINIPVGIARCQFHTLRGYLCPWALPSANPRVFPAYHQRPCVFTLPDRPPIFESQCWITLQTI